MLQRMVSSEGLTRFLSERNFTVTNQCTKESNHSIGGDKAWQIVHTKTLHCERTGHNAGKSMIWVTCCRQHECKCPLGLIPLGRQTKNIAHKHLKHALLAVFCYILLRSVTAEECSGCRNSALLMSSNKIQCFFFFFLQGYVATDYPFEEPRR